MTIITIRKHNPVIRQLATTNVEIESIEPTFEMPEQGVSIRPWAVRQIHYNSTKYPRMPLQNRHCRVLTVATGRPKNQLVQLANGRRVVVPQGNLFDAFSYPPAPKNDGRRTVIDETPAVETHWQDAFGQLRADRRYDDDTPVSVTYVANAKGGELQSWAVHNVNTDVPDNRAFLDMGLSTAENAALDARGPHETRSMNAADMRERCVVYGGRMFALYEKRAADFKPPWFKDYERLAEMLVIDRPLAMELAAVIDRYGFNRQLANGLVNGHTASDGTPRAGLRAKAGQVAEMTKLVRYLEDLDQQADEVVLDDDEGIEGMDAFYSQHMIYDLADEDEEDDDFEPRSDEIGAHPLSDGSDGIEYDLIDEIKSAGPNEISTIQRRFFEQTDRATGRVYLAEYRWMTPAQQSIAWGYINDRKARLVKDGLQAMTRRGRKVLAFAKKLGRSAQARALITAWAAPGTFDLGGVKLVFRRKPSEIEVYAAWSAYKKLN